MLIEFSVSNYLSFKKKVTFSMVATNLPVNERLDENNVFKVDNELSLLKSAAVYGTNASGKSNLAKAINFMRWFVLNSSKSTQITDSIDVKEFKLNQETIGKPSFFEIIFLLNKKIYRYGFELDKEQVVSEWLFYTPKLKEYKYFERKKQKFSIIKKFSEGQSIDSKTRPNALFLSVAAQFNGKISEQILFWFESIGIFLGIGGNLSNRDTLKLMNEKKYRKDIIELIKKLDLSINDIKIQPITVSTFDIKTIHNQYDSAGNIVDTTEFDMNENESEGTKKLFAFAGPILKTLREGKILLIDEFDARLHPLITKTLVELFNSKKTNPYNAQLIFITHNTNLLNKNIFRKDQIWFAEKDRHEATDLYSLVEYNVSNDAVFESDYIKGRYGAIPFIGDIRSLIID